MKLYLNFLMNFTYKTNSCLDKKKCNIVEVMNKGLFLVQINI